MIFGNPSRVAIESQISTAYARQSQLALGYFVIHVGGLSYGVRERDATLLGCSFGEVERRLHERGHHSAPFPRDTHGLSIAAATIAVILGSSPEVKSELGISEAEFNDALYGRNLIWAPDGDEAFDDGSYVLQFDVDAQVRLIAFKTNDSAARVDRAWLRDVWLAADEYYQVLQKWRDGFLSEWNAAEKTALLDT